MDMQVSAIINELESQRAWALTRCTMLVQEIVKRDAEIKTLNARIEALQKPAKPKGAK